ncbi:type 2 lanthipeptide synthetase LanM family protein [Hyalangium sp. s54d21]|uniref:Type 2 lanthipeptide synthetase LanM family protein n=1 Tax=Hyalangium rubrum TaxID=3103134 RepID=A0ABU5H4J7_9BACT|nr:type 2 lanthipeptide synthetase LanM family protein [Hyalangium sp. s54d21]
MAAERCAAEPEWACAVRESLEARLPESPRLALPSHWKSKPGGEFWGFIEPLIRRAHAKLEAGANKLLRARVHVPLSRESLGDLLMSCLPDDLLKAMLRTLVLELNVARLQEQLKGQSPQERYREFAARISTAESALALFAEYPILARQLVSYADDWCRTTLELLERLCQDWPLITRAFEEADPSGVLVGIDGGAGDKHRGRASVALLRFSTGFQLVYKPRSLAVDLHFQELLGTFNEWGFQPTFRRLRVLDRGAYGWVERIDARGCGSLAEVQRFYRRQGGYLAVLYTLRATDIHFENIIANGEHPTLVDLESVIHPVVKRNDLGAGDFLSESILQVGLLPIRIWENESSPGIDVSALGVEEGQLTPRADPYWSGSGTDQMRMTRKHRKFSGQGHHRPTFEGRPIPALEHVAEIVGGFEDMYRLILSRRSELLADDGPLRRFERDEIRVLLRPTVLYSLMLQESSHPDFLRDELDRERFFDKLWVQAQERAYLRRVISAEKADLRRGDIPAFMTLPGSRDLWTSTGERLPDFLAESAMSQVHARLEDLGEGDLKQQLWFIHASLAILSTSNVEHERSPALEPTSAPTRHITAERVRRLATLIGDRLCDVAMEEGDDVHWLGLVPNRHRQYTIASLNENLYSGTSGIALFLAYLGQITGEARYTQMAHRACRAILQKLREQRLVVEGIGAFEGLGGIVYTLHHLAALWDQPKFLTDAQSLFRLISERIEGDERLDVMGGAAGCLLALSTLWRREPSEELRGLMLRCGERIEQRAVQTAQGTGWLTTGESNQPLTGLSHGAAGIAAALFELSAIEGTERFRKLALEGLHYERSLFSPEHGNWPDVRTESERFARFNWCHGAPGIGLARLRILGHEETPELRAEIEIAVRTTLAHGFGRNHSLCHGDLGNLDLLLAANASLPSLHVQGELDRLAAKIVEDIEARGARSGLPLGVETPGLMVGLSGIGLGLLRIAAPERVPSVLSLAPPSARVSSSQGPRSA